jgi:hypothetical protein
MFGWIENLFARAGNAVDNAVKALIHVAISGIYGFLHSLFGNVIRAWDQHYNAVRAYISAELEFLRDVYNAFIRIFRVHIPRLDRRITIVYVTINNRITVIVRDYNTKIITERKQRQAAILSLLWWVIHHVVIPFLAKFATIFRWLAREGATMWHYFTHLAEFAELLFWYLVRSLEKHAWDAARLLGQFLLALIVHNLVRFVKLMEAILYAVL